MVKYIKFDGKPLLIRIPSKTEITNINKRPLQERYKWYVNLIKNEKVKVNDFTGNVRMLNKLIDLIGKEI